MLTCGKSILVYKKTWSVFDNAWSQFTFDGKRVLKRCVLAWFFLSSRQFIGPTADSQSGQWLCVFRKALFGAFGVLSNEQAATVLKEHHHVYPDTFRWGRGSPSTHFSNPALPCNYISNTESFLWKYTIEATCYFLIMFETQYVHNLLLAPHANRSPLHTSLCICMHLHRAVNDKFKSEDWLRMKLVNVVPCNM